MTVQQDVPFPWADAMQFGFGILKLSSQQFWDLTPHELAAAMKTHAALSKRDGAPSASQLANLMQRYPDTPHKD